MTATRILNDEDVRAFGRDGFLVKRGLFDATEMAEITGWVDELGATPERRGGQWMYFEQSLVDPDRRILNRIENFHTRHDGFRRLFDGAKIKGACGALLNEPAALYKEKINFKQPGGDGFKPHQDQQAGWDKYADFFVTVLVSVDEATAENGCLELVAGRHMEGLIGKEWEPISDADWRAMDVQRYPTKPGDAIFFDSFAPHGSGPNLSDSQRRVLYVTYNAASKGDHRTQYYTDKFANYPPDVERDPDKDYAFKV